MKVPGQSSTVAGTTTKSATTMKMTSTSASSFSSSSLRQPQPDGTPTPTMTPPPEFKRRSLRMSIRKSLQPFANMLVLARKPKDSQHQHKQQQQQVRPEQPPAGEPSVKLRGQQIQSDHSHPMPTGSPLALMKRRSLRNTICLSTLDLNDVGIPKEVEPVFVQSFCRHEQQQQQQQQHRRHQQQQPHLKEDSAMRQSASHTNKARSLADSYGDDKCSSSHKNDNKSAIQQWRKAKRAADEDHLWPRPLPRTSLLRQENAPPAPPRRMSLGDHLTTKPFEVEGRICTDEGIGGGGRSLRLREQPAARSTTSIEKNLPSATVSNAMKRKLRRVDGRVADGIADDEESFVEWSSTAGSATGEGRKRRKTVRFQDSNNNNNINSSSISSNNLALLRNSDQSSGRAKLQLCLYLNYGHVSVHVMRGANLPLLPDQHELNSYVKVNFEPSDLRSQHRSQVVSGTVDPSYDFRLSFEIPPEAACERSVLVTVWHRDYITKQSRLLGFLNFSLTKIMEAKRIEGWFRLPSLAVTKKTHI